MSEQEPPVQPGAPAPRNAKAEAKAAKAYAKAERPWYKKKRFIIPLGLILLTIVVSAGSSGGGNDNNRATNDSTTTEQAPAAKTQAEKSQSAPSSTGPTAKFPLTDGDWRLDSVSLKDDGLGDFGGTGRVTYTGANPQGGTNLFTVTVFVGGNQVAALEGSASDVTPGDAVTVQFISQDKFVGGQYKFDFQNNI